MKLNRSLQRGIQVMRALQDATALTLADLNRATGLPKATLLRILLTLEEERLVWRSVGDQLFRYRSGALASSWYRNQSLALAAAPWLTALQKRTLWPSDVVARRGYYMELVETSRGLPNIVFSRDTLGERIDIAGSAVGRAYLAFCGERERRSVIGHIAHHPELRGPLGPVDRPALERSLGEIRRAGYATRDHTLSRRLAHLGEADDGLDAIAVPILHGRSVLGAINIVWPRRLNLRARIVANHLADLRDAAVGIARAIRDTGRTRETKPSRRKPAGDTAEP